MFIFSNAYCKIKLLYVILSVGRHECRPKSNFCGLSASEQAKARGLSRSGIWLQILVACGWNVTFVKAGHPNSLPYPFVALLLGFVSDRRRERLTPSTKLRLRASHSAQNDMLIVRFAIIVHFWATYGRPLRLVYLAKRGFHKWCQTKVLFFFERATTPKPSP